MDYEKLHKDTINKLQQMVNSGKITVEIARGICTDFVPESDDERIRKRIIHALHGDVLEMSEIKEAVDWLEKQGKQKSIDDLTQQEVMDIAVAKCFEQGEQKPADEVEPRQEELTEFERAVKQVMEEAIECGDTHNLKADADMLLRLVQKPWGEEDEHGFENCLYAIKETFKEVDNPHRVGTVNWLKSLKERYTWKPSDKQMEALDDVIDEYDGYPEFDSLVSLKNDLKKLREK